jgi:hypothetical protein
MDLRKKDVLPAKLRADILRCKRILSQLLSYL